MQCRSYKMTLFFLSHHKNYSKRISYNNNYIMKGATPQEITAQFHQLGVLLLLDAPENL